MSYMFIAQWCVVDKKVMAAAGSRSLVPPLTCISDGCRMARERARVGLGSAETPRSLLGGRAGGHARDAVGRYLRVGMLSCPGSNSDSNLCHS